MNERAINLVVSSLYSEKERVEQQSVKLEKELKEMNRIIEEKVQSSLE